MCKIKTLSGEKGGCKNTYINFQFQWICSIQRSSTYTFVFRPYEAYSANEGSLSSKFKVLI